MDEIECIDCPLCGGTAEPMGSLGWRRHYRCRDCGLDSSVDVKPPPALEPGRYEVVDQSKPLCWRAFHLSADGRVVFEDWDDGHSVYWTVRGAEGDAWLAERAAEVASGKLRRVR